MPSVSKKQHNLMAMVANDPDAAKRVGVPQSVGEEFVKADKGKKFGAGKAARPDLQKVNKSSTRHGKGQLFAEGGMPIQIAKDSKYRSQELDEMKRKAVSREKDEEKDMKKGGKVKKMAMGGYAGGGMPMVMKDGQKVPAFAADGKGKMAKGGMAMKKMAGGGLAAGHKSADGVAHKGKTKARQVTMGGSTGMKKGGMTKMKYGGKAC